MADGRAARLRRQHAALLAACRAHPFVRGIADGTLPAPSFRRWVVQDWLYLLTYADVLDVAAASAPSPEARRRWAGLASLTREVELDLHRAFAARYDLSAADLDGAAPTEATTGYTRFLRAHAARGYGPLVASLVPCGVDYVEIARALSGEVAPPYAAWVETYADPAFADAVAFMQAELDAAPGDEAELETAYAAGAAHELAFWDAAMRSRAWEAERSWRRSSSRT